MREPCELNRPLRQDDKLTELVEQAGSQLDVVDERTHGTAQTFTFTATLSTDYSVKPNVLLL